MTDIEKMIKEITDFQEKTKDFTRKNSIDVDYYLVFLCHPDTKKIVDVAIKEAGLSIPEEQIHVYKSKYYSPGDIYAVTDRKLKRKILKQHGIKVEGEEYMVYQTYYSMNDGIRDTNGQVQVTIRYLASTTNHNGYYYDWT